MVLTFFNRACSWIQAFMMPYMPVQHTPVQHTVSLHTIGGETMVCTLPCRSQIFPDGVVIQEELQRYINQQIPGAQYYEWSCIGCGNSSDLNLITQPKLHITEVRQSTTPSRDMYLNIKIPQQDFEIELNMIEYPSDILPKNWIRMFSEIELISLFNTSTIPWRSMEIRMNFPSKPRLSCKLDNPNLGLTHRIRDFVYEMIGLYRSISDENMNIRSFIGRADENIQQEDLYAIQMCLHYYTSPLIRRYWTELKANFIPYSHYFEMSRNRTDHMQTTFKYKLSTSDPKSAPREISVPFKL